MKLIAIIWMFMTVFPASADFQAGAYRHLGIPATLVVNADASIFLLNKNDELIASSQFDSPPHLLFTPEGVICYSYRLKEGLADSIEVIWEPASGASVNHKPYILGCQDFNGLYKRIE